MFTLFEYKYELDNILADFILPTSSLLYTKVLERLHNNNILI